MESNIAAVIDHNALPTSNKNIHNHTSLNNHSRPPPKSTSSLERSTNGEPQRRKKHNDLLSS